MGGVSGDVVPCDVLWGNSVVVQHVVCVHTFYRDFTRFAPLDQQPSLKRAREEMSEVGRVITLICHAK